MMEVVFGVIGALIGLGGLATTYAAHRHQRRHAEQLDARERRIEEREREAELREASQHASMLQMKITQQSSSLEASISIWKLTVKNCSSQPFTNVSLSYVGLPLNGPELGGLLDPGASAEDTLTVGRGDPDPDQCLVEFTDAEGRRWRRRATGDLRQGRTDSQGRLVWEPGVLHAARYPDMGFRYIHRSRVVKRRRLIALCILTVVSIAPAWYLALR
ncbi:hypothetical protein G5C60_04505 [Streptomyces sp. HC44]|uniref:Uncharacterized protein n=1 Tax=Streptomyces scabichelini TaxID=2711217 RepID=A0A6G4UZ57_9ACTN|nr:hypothetical protein [Streptomyces scabichelini]NGO06940.1 hypothetical protein [Streptomyces scabichelini]